MPNGSIDLPHDRIMNLRRVQYFVAVAEEENLHLASKRMHVAQPALSRQIKLLETELGVQLFERLPRGIRLTAAGRAYLEDAKSAARG